MSVQHGIPQLSIHIIEYLSTSDVEFKINHRCSVRIGPLAYITSDIGYVWDNKREQPMQHKMLEGTYRTHRLRKEVQEGGVSWVDDYTVTTLDDIDPLKIIEYMCEISAVSLTAMKKDMFFDHCRWMRFVGKRLPQITSCQLMTKKMVPDDTLIDVHAWSCHSRNRSLEIVTKRDYVKQQMAMTAYLCRLLWCSKQQSGKDEYSLSEEEMIRCDKNTVYIRQLSKSLNKKPKIVASHDLTGVRVNSEKDKTPSIVGFYHECNERHGMCGYVLYTHSDLDGVPLRQPRAFAIVLGPAFHTEISGSKQFGDNVFGSPIACSRFKAASGQQQHDDKYKIEVEPTEEAKESFESELDTETAMYVEDNWFNLSRGLSSIEELERWLTDTEM